jgi:sec-independent protein translocase protein TatB
MGFGEMVVLGIILLVVVGPRELPRMLRSLGQGIRKLRAMSTDLREQSGIDDIIRDEGLKEDLDTIRSLSRGRMVDSLVRDVMAPPRARPATRNVPSLDELTKPEGSAPEPGTEYPIVGCDDYGVLADDATAEVIEARRKELSAETKQLEAAAAAAIEAEQKLKSQLAAASAAKEAAIAAASAAKQLAPASSETSDAEPATEPAAAPPALESATPAAAADGDAPSESDDVPSAESDAKGPHGAAKPAGATAEDAR